MWLTAIILGFAGSLHCVGMCSPLAMAVTSLSGRVLLNRFLYNGGRIFTYSLFGALFSGVGAQLPIAGYQSLISITLGIVLLVVALFGLRGMALPFLDKLFAQFSSWLKMRFSTTLAKKSKASMFMLGMLNGFLPCGLTFLAFTYTITLQGPIDGFNFMLLFGVGTLPAMLGLTWALQQLVARMRWSLSKVSTSMMIISGVALIARALWVAGQEAHLHGQQLVDVVLCR